MSQKVWSTAISPAYSGQSLVGAGEGETWIFWYKSELLLVWLTHVDHQQLSLVSLKQDPHHSTATILLLTVIFLDAIFMKVMNLAKQSISYQYLMWFYIGWTLEKSNHNSNQVYFSLFPHIKFNDTNIWYLMHHVTIRQSMQEAQLFWCCVSCFLWTSNKSCLLQYNTKHSTYSQVLNVKVSVVLQDG